MLSENLLLLLADLVSFHTVVGNNVEKTKCLDWVQKNFLAYVDPTFIQRGEVNGAPYLLVTPPTIELMWFAHLDVIPADDAMFQMMIDGDRALGRGVKDMKGAALTFLMAYRDHCETHGVPPVGVLLCTDEETGGGTIAALFDQKILRDIPVAYTPDGGGEHPVIVVEQMGAAWSQLTCHGKGAHGAMPWDGQNPIHLLAEVLLDLQARFPIGRSDSWHTTVTPTQIEGSDARNKIPDAATCTLDIRFPKSESATPAEAIAKVRSILPPRCTLEPLATSSPVAIDPKHPMVLRFKRIAEEVTGETVSLCHEHGASDARYFDERGVPAFLYGPIGGGLHAPNEWVSIPSLMEHVEMHRRLIASFG